MQGFEFCLWVRHLMSDLLTSDSIHFNRKDGLNCGLATKTSGKLVFLGQPGPGLLASLRPSALFSP